MSDVQTKAQNLRDQAAQCRNRAEESFRNCDTDGFLSQWANSISARKLEMQATLLENGNKSTFPCLMYGDEVVAERTYTFPDKIRTWTSNDFWKLPNDLAVKLGRRWIPVGARSRVQKQLGLREGSVERPAVVVVTTGRNNHQTGSGGCANAHVCIVRADEEALY